MSDRVRSDTKADGERVPKRAGRARLSPYDRIKKALLDRELDEGEALPESRLAEMCGVSRTPVREALSRLEQDGLVRRTDRGFVVRERSPAEILDIYETRVILEATAARNAAERRTNHDIAFLRRDLDLARAVDPHDSAQMIEANKMFHRGIWQASHNDSLMDLLERIELQIARYPGTTLTHGDRWKHALDEHAKILLAIELRDGDTAFTEASKHFEAAGEIRLKQWMDR